MRFYFALSAAPDEIDSAEWEDDEIHIFFANKGFHSNAPYMALSKDAAQNLYDTLGGLLSQPSLAESAE